MSDVIKRIGDCRIVPVVVLDTAERAVPTANALFSGGVDIMEITLRTAAGLESIRRVSGECSDICVGAGTVLTVDKCKQAVDVGACFIVSPGFNGPIVEWCLANEIIVVPGCVTPSEIMLAMSYDINVLKFFPADVYGGLPAMKALSAPFHEVKFIPTGGISGKNLREYISAPFVHAVGGSWMCGKADIEDGKFDRIAGLAAEAVRIKNSEE